MSSNERLTSQELFERGLTAKQEEIEILETKNLELNGALNAMEDEMEGLAQLLMEKDAELRKILLETYISH